MEYPSALVEKAVNEIAKLPGIGKKTSLRMVLHLLKAEKTEGIGLSSAIKDLVDNIQYCKKCHNISDEEECAICKSPRRDPSTVCIVEDTRDVIAIENTEQYRGLYHVLGGLISPVEGVGPEQLNIPSLVDRATNENSEVREVIFALSPTMEGDTTAFYITRKLENQDIRITSIARGIPVGGELEYADEITLGRSILARTNYDSS